MPGTAISKSVQRSRNPLEAMRQEATELTTKRAQQLCTVLECRLNLVMESTELSQAAAPEGAAAAMLANPPPPVPLFRQGTNVQKLNVRVPPVELRMRYGRVPGDEPPALTPGGLAYVTDQDLEDEEDGTAEDGFSAGRSAVAASKGKGRGGGRDSRPVPNAKAGVALDAPPTRDSLKQKSENALKREMEKKARAEARR